MAVANADDPVVDGRGRRRPAGVRWSRSASGAGGAAASTGEPLVDAGRRADRRRRRAAPRACPTTWPTPWPPRPARSAAGADARRRARAVLRRLRGARPPGRAGRRGWWACAWYDDSKATTPASVLAAAGGLRLGRAHRRRAATRASTWRRCGHARRRCAPSSPSARRPPRSRRPSPEPAPRSWRPASMDEAVRRRRRPGPPRRRRAAVARAAPPSTGTAPTPSGATTSPAWLRGCGPAGLRWDGTGTTTARASTHGGVGGATRRDRATVARPRSQTGRPPAVPRAARTGARGRASASARPSVSVLTRRHRPGDGAVGLVGRRRSSSTASRGPTSSARSSGWPRRGRPGRVRQARLPHWRRFSVPLLGLVARPARRGAGPRRRASLSTGRAAGSGSGSFQIQPSELAKLALVALRRRPAGPAGRSDARQWACTVPAGGHGRSSSLAAARHEAARHGHDDRPGRHRRSAMLFVAGTPARDAGGPRPGQRRRPAVLLGVAAPYRLHRAAVVPATRGRDRAEHRLPGRPGAGGLGLAASSWSASGSAPAGRRGATCPTPTPTSSSPSSARSWA